MVQQLSRFLTGLLMIALTIPAVGQTPFNIPLAGEIKDYKTDKRSREFQRETLWSIKDMLNLNLSERNPVNDASIMLDPSKLILSTAADVRVYFIGEGAAYRNTLGFNTSGGDYRNPDSRLIFPNASSLLGTEYTQGTLASGKRNADNPLLPGDFVDLGRFSAGTTLDFFLIANGAAGGKNVFSTRTQLNPDRINHAVAFTLPNSPYLIIGFEDLLGGGDRDFNDLLFAVDIGVANVQHLAGSEPITLAMFGALGSLLVVARRRVGNRQRTTGQDNLHMA